MQHTKAIFDFLTPPPSIAQCRELENNHHEKLSDIAVVTLEKLMKNELEEEMSEDVRMVSWYNLSKEDILDRWFIRRGHM